MPRLSGPSRSAAPVGGAVTVGVDIGTTSVKALAVDADGTVVARARVPHRIVTDSADHLAHDARAAWHDNPRKAYAAVAAETRAPVIGLSVAAMVPSLTAVDARGIPLLPGLLYGDTRGTTGAADAPAARADPGPAMGGAMADAEGFLRWAAQEAPEAAGFWPAQAVATNALCGVPAVDTAMTASLGALHTWGQWNADLLADIGVRPDQLPVVVPMCESGGTLSGSDTVFAGGTVDALCDQIVSGATEPGDVLAIFGATLVVWIVTDEWLEVPDLITVPHLVPDRVLVGGPSNAGALFVDWSRRLLEGPVSTAASRAPREGDGRGELSPEGVPVWLPYLRGERTPFNDPGLRASLHGLDITQGPAAVERAAYEASGFVIRRLLDRSGLAGRRIVASGGGSASAAWMAAVADATGLPVDSVAVSEGAALGAAFMARMAAGEEASLDGSSRWARTGRRHQPDDRWAAAAERRYTRFVELGPGT